MPQPRDLAIPSHAELDDGVRRGTLLMAEGSVMRRWELIARLNVMVRRGEIAPDMIEVQSGERIAVYAVRLKPARAVWPRRTCIALAISAAASGLAWMIWDARYVIGAVLLGLLSLAVVITALAHIGTGSSGCSCIIHGRKC